MGVRERPGRFPVAIIGPGALGLFFASRLSRVVCTALIARSASRAAELRKGVQVGARTFHPEAFGPERLPQADWVIVLVKTHQTRAAARIAARMNAKGVISLQNGLIEELPQGVTTAAAWRDAKRVVPVAKGLTVLPPGFAVLGRYLARAGFPVRTVRNIRKARWEKLLANVCVNPVTAVFGIRNGELQRLPYRRFAEALAREAAPVLRMSPESAVRRVMDAAKATAKNRSSMLQDVLAGRPTENEHLTGALLRLGRRGRVDLPTHRAFYQLMRLIGPR